MCTYIHTHTYIQTYTHTYMHAHIQAVGIRVQLADTFSVPKNGYFSVTHVYKGLKSDSYSDLHTHTDSDMHTPYVGGDLQDQMMYVCPDVVYDRHQCPQVCVCVCVYVCVCAWACV